METLAWEETMIQACTSSFSNLLLLVLIFRGFSAVHPEMQYLQQEMIKRRDKRLELASRKRSYEIGNATKRRRADEDGVWSWWKVPLLTSTPPWSICYPETTWDTVVLPEWTCKT